MSDSRFTATKLDANKPPMDLIPWEAMAGAAQVLDFGRQKYAPHNWRKGFLWTRLASAGLRHIFAWLSGEDKDPESGLSHIDHALCCLMFLSAHIKGKDMGKDDRACRLLTEGTSDFIPAARVPNVPEIRYQWHMSADDANTVPDKRLACGPKYVSRSLAEHARPQLIEAGILEDEDNWYLIAEVEADKP